MNQQKQHPKKPREVFLDDIISFGKYFNTFTYKQVQRTDKSYFQWMLSENVIKVLGDKRPPELHTSEDEDWKDVSPEIMRRWSSGYLCTKHQPSPETILIF